MATKVLIAINVIIYALTCRSGAPSRQFGLIPARVLQDKEYYRLITCMFLHGSIYHIFMNMYALYGLGGYLERRLGTMRFAAVYLLLGAAAGASSIFIRNAVGRSNVASIGASGAIYGLFGIIMAGMIRSMGVARALQYNKRTLVILVLMFLAPGIDNYAHVCGLAAGVLAGLFLLR